MEKVRNESNRRKDADPEPTVRKEKVSGLTDGKQISNAALEGCNKDKELAVEKKLEEEGLKKAKAELQKLVEADNSLATLAVAIGPKKL